LRRDKLKGRQKCCRWWAKNDILTILWPTEKVDGSWFFRPDFDKIDPKVAL
jgi:hypothetical protein